MLKAAFVAATLTQSFITLEKALKKGEQQGFTTLEQNTVNINSSIPKDK